MSKHVGHKASSPVLTEADLVAEAPETRSQRRSKLLPALGIDYGTKFVGVALATSPLAQPLTIAANNDHLLSYLCTLIDDYRIKTVVVGMSESRTAQLTKQFLRQLAATVPARIELTDETLTTQVVRAKLRAAGRRLKTDDRVDHYAAAELLQEWLDTQEKL